MSFSDQPLVQFAAYVAGGALVFFAIIWVQAASSGPGPDWLPDEGIIYFGGCGLIAFLAGWWTGLSTWRDIWVAALIVSGISLVVYFGPLAFLLPYPLSSLLQTAIPVALTLFLLYGALILAATCLRLGHRPGGTP